MRSQVNSRHAIVASLLIMSLAGCGKPSYDLTGKYKAGDILRDELHFSMPAGRLIAKAKGGAVEGKASFDGHTVREVTVLAIDRKGQPTKFKVSHLVDQFTMRLEAPGDKPEETTESGMLQGESIIFEMVAGEWNKTLFGKQPTPEQAKELQDCDNPLEEDLIPKGPVKLGSSWMARDSALRKYIGSGLHNLRGSMSVEFNGVVERDGQQCALIAGDLDVEGTGLDPDSRENHVSMSAHLTIHRSLKSFCDSTSGEGMMKIETETVAEGTSVRVTINGPLTLKQEQSRL